MNNIPYPSPAFANSLIEQAVQAAHAADKMVEMYGRDLYRLGILPPSEPRRVHLQPNHITYPVGAFLKEQEED